MHLDLLTLSSYLQDIGKSELLYNNMRNMQYIFLFDLYTMLNIQKIKCRLLLMKNIDNDFNVLNLIVYV